MAARRQGSVRRRHGSSCATRAGGRRCTCSAGWSFRATVGGRRLERSGFATKPEAEAALRDALADVARSVQQADQKWRTPFSVYAERYLASREQEWRPGTLATNTPIVRGAMAYFGPAPIGRIDPEQVRAFRDRVAETRGPVTTRNWLVTLSGLFRRAVAEGYAPANPVASVEPPRREHVERAWPTRAEVAAIVSAADPEWAPLFRLAAETGMRRGELLGLRWGDVDLVRRRARVARSRGQYGVGSPKTAAGTRLVPLTRPMADTLAELRLASRHKGDDDPVFAHLGGGHRLPSHCHRAFVAARRAAGVRDGITLHAFRHFAASLFISQGHTVLTVQKVLGHASATETLNRYAHLWPDALDALAESVEEIMAPEAGAGPVVPLMP